jgi:hypothetical protein
MIPPFAVVAANPLVIVLVLAVVGVDLLTKFAVEIVEVVLVARLAEEAILIVLHTRTNLLVDFFGGAHAVETLAAVRHLLPSLGLTLTLGRLLTVP